VWAEGQAGHFDWKEENEKLKNPQKRLRQGSEDEESVEGAFIRGGTLLKIEYIVWRGKSESAKKTRRNEEDRVSLATLRASRKTCGIEKGGESS